MILDYEYPVVYFNGDDYEDSDVINKAGQIELLQISQEPYEAIVNAEGYSFHILFGSKTGGNFLCIPGWRMGCELSYLSDIFWNQHSILGDDQRFVYENATAVAYALKKLKDVIE